MANQDQQGVCAGTPVVSVLDNRGSPVRLVNYNRVQADVVLSELIERTERDAKGNIASTVDPRLYRAMLDGAAVAPNFRFHRTLSGIVIRSDTVDAGTSTQLIDVEGRTAWQRNAAGVLHRFGYEARDAGIGRLTARYETPANGSEAVRERYVYTDASEISKAANLCGQCIRHYDTAGLRTLVSVSLTGATLCERRQLPADVEEEVDWQGDNEQRDWQSLLAEEIYTTTLTVDAAGFMTSRTDAKQNVQRFVYDLAGRLVSKSITLAGGVETLVTRAIEYTAASMNLREESGTGITISSFYEPETLRLKRTTTMRPARNGKAAALLQDLQIEYDPVGNVTSVRNDAEILRYYRNQKVAPQNTYRYDALYQLVGATGRESSTNTRQTSALPALIALADTDASQLVGYTRAYEYDSAGNLGRVTHHGATEYTSSITVSARSNHAAQRDGLTSDKVEELFDACGRPESLDQGMQLVWDNLSRLRRVVTMAREAADSDREIYLYDSDGVRLLKQGTQLASGTTRTLRTVYLPGLELRSVANGAGASEVLQVVRLASGGICDGSVLRWEKGKPAGVVNDQFRYGYQNFVGSSELELDSEARVISREEYFPFGGTAVWSARSAVEAKYKTTRYSGKERDASGLYYYGYRYYQPWLGRWLSADPAGPVDGTNLFCMVGNNPITLYDDNGSVGTIRDQVAHEFVLEKHITAIEEASRKGRFAVSFRSAGAATIEALGRGAAAKGHDILEKTIKEASIKKAYPENAEEMLGYVRAAGIEGYVGHWDEKSGVLKGIYMSKGHQLGSLGPKNIFPIDMANLEESLAPLKARPNWGALPFTGDYDTHDMITFRGAGRPRTVLSGPLGDMAIKDLINRAVATADPEHRPFDKIEHNVVRHGPQVNYVSYMLSEERAEVERARGFVGAVANPGAFPIAFVDRGEWSIVHDVTELASFYKKRGAVIKDAWNPQGSRVYTPLKRGSGTVKASWRPSPTR